MSVKIDVVKWAEVAALLGGDFKLDYDHQGTIELSPETCKALNVPYCSLNVRLDWGKGGKAVVKGLFKDRSGRWSGCQKAESAGMSQEREASRLVSDIRARVLPSYFGHLPIWIKEEADDLKRVQVQASMVKVVTDLLGADGHITNQTEYETTLYPRKLGIDKIQIYAGSVRTIELDAGSDVELITRIIETMRQAYESDLEESITTDIAEEVQEVMQLQ